jgi:ribose/xylose/arabinose/galactoside ABC-type transport system permease subunit
MAIVPVLLMGLGQTFVVIAAGIDLSVGWVMGLSSVVSALVIVGLVDKGIYEPVAIALGCVAGIVAAMIPGLINGVIIAKLRIPSFIVTLGMLFIARGVAFLLSGVSSKKTLNSTRDKRMKSSRNLVGERGRPASSAFRLRQARCPMGERKSYFTLVGDKMKWANRTPAMRECGW